MNLVHSLGRTYKPLHALNQVHLDLDVAKTLVFLRNYDSSRICNQLEPNLCCIHGYKKVKIKKLKIKN
jgi:hypothetical protein